MKKIFILISLLYNVSLALAQTNYYAVTKTFNKQGYTYQCDVIDKAKFVRLYNKENKFTYADQINKSTGKTITIAEENEGHIERETWTKPKCFSIINNAFSSIEKQRIKGKAFTIILYINPDDGKIAEVEYQFVSFGPYATIPVSVYHNIEAELKKNIWFTPTKEGAKYNYIFLGWRHEVK